MLNKRWLLIIGISCIIFTACGILHDENNMEEQNNNSTVNKRFDEGEGYLLNSEVENVNDHLDYDNRSLKTIHVAGGCFWGVEAYMQQIYGVAETSSGYANGTGQNPTYDDVIRGQDEFVEAVAVTYDPQRVTLEELIDRLFIVIDPTSEDRQGNDVGIQYRTGIYYSDKTDAEIIEKTIENEQQHYKKKIVTEVEPLDEYYLAEDMHQDYLAKNPNGYCHVNLNIVNEFKIKPIDEDEDIIQSLSEKYQSEG